MNALDKVIGWIAPATGLRRARARMMMSQVRRYDAAASGRRTDGWLAQGQSANTEIQIALAKLRDRHRELVRNNPWAARAVQAIVNNTVGYGITAKITGNTKQRALWKAWADTTACDADGRHDFYGLQALILRTVAESGECIVRKRVRRLEDGLPIPLQIQVLEPDYLDHSKTIGLPNGGWITQGIQFTPFGKREGYWLFKDHPGDQTSMRPLESAFVPASEVAHVFRTDRPGQARGTPWGASAMLTMRDLDDYEDAYLFRQKLANCQVGVITDARDLQSGDTVEPNGQALSETMEPGRYDFLPTGKDIRFNTPPSAGDYGPYTRDVLLRVAAAYGITFQALTGDLSSVNFSSGRMGWIEMSRNIEAWRWQMLIPQGCAVVAAWFVEIAQTAGASMKGVTFGWTPPRREMIDPSKEIAAMREAIRAGLMPLSEAHRQLGEDSDDLLEEYAQVNVKIDAKNLVFDSDPRKVSAAGLAQARPAGTEIPSTDVGDT